MTIKKDSELFKEIETGLKESENYMFKEIGVGKPKTKTILGTIKEIKQIDCNEYKVIMTHNNNEKVYTISKCNCCCKGREMEKPIIKNICYCCFAAYY